MGPCPEKIKSNTNFPQGEYVINEMEEEPMDVEVEENLGYIRISQGNDEDIPANDSTDEEEDEDSEDENEFVFQEQPPPIVDPIVSSSAELQAIVWNSQPPPATIEISTETSQQIKQIMSNFNIPNAPAWINEISTETLISKIKNRQQ